MPFPPPGDLLNPGFEPALSVSPVLVGRFSPLVPPGKLLKQMYWKNKNRFFKTTEQRNNILVTVCTVSNVLNIVKENRLRVSLQDHYGICCCLVCKAEKAMAPHSSTLAWKIPWTEEPGR